MLPRMKKSGYALAVLGLVVALTGHTGPVASADPGDGAAVSSSGEGTAAYAGEVNASDNAKGSQRAGHGRSFGTLRRDGRPSEPTPGAQPTTTKGDPSVTGPYTAPNSVRLNFPGIGNADAHCNCQPPDVNAAVSKSHIAETTNLELRVFDKAGTQLVTTGLNTFFNTSASLSDPRILFDNAWQRWVLVTIPIPTSSSSQPQMLLAVTSSSNPTGTWRKYTIGFGGGAFPAGTLLDYPQIGMDSDALVITSNNFQLQPNSSYNYIGTTAFAIAKQRPYNGLGFGFGAFGINYNTSPAFVAGIPMQQPNSLYLLSPNAGGNGGAGSFLLYNMTNTSKSSPSLFLQANINVNWAPPTRAANQPGRPGSLDTLDGRFVWAPMQNANHLWFAHTANFSGFPAVQYGFVDTNANTIASAFAYHSASSDDWNPSIAVSPGSGGENVFLNWAYTDSPNGVPVTATYSGLRPGEAVTGIVGSPALVTGSTTGQSRFGDYSSVAIDPSSYTGCSGVGRNAVIAQQYFNADGTWQTRIAEIGHC